MREGDFQGLVQKIKDSLLLRLDLVNLALLDIGMKRGVDTETYDDPATYYELWMLVGNPISMEQKTRVVLFDDGIPEFTEDVIGQIVTQSCKEIIDMFYGEPPKSIILQ